MYGKGRFGDIKVCSDADTVIVSLHGYCVATVRKTLIRYGTIHYSIRGINVVYIFCFKQNLEGKEAWESFLFGCV